jgi:hypothetical protein
MIDPRGQRRDAPARDATETMRTFVDADGARWYVHEQAFSEYDRRKGRSLIFSSEAAVRRVRDYPGDWISLTDAELADLSWKA